MRAKMLEKTPFALLNGQDALLKLIRIGKTSWIRCMSIIRPLVTIPVFQVEIYISNSNDHTINADMYTYKILALYQLQPTRGKRYLQKNWLGSGDDVH